ncbi:MAG: P1 family peptidase [Armatimonadetes bacterium]|nr:P1 family peptidase [Armatimonadota bacterium]MDW8027740.1 P1 family peptidase [Armatimonadota bacterium]
MDWSVFEGVKVGHLTDYENKTGVTTILFENGATAGVEVRGSASGTFGTDTASPLHLVPKIHAVVFTGGSSFGLESVFGVMQWLEEKGIGFDTQVAKVPIVVGAVIFDLRFGSPKVRPKKEWGYNACQRASNSEMRQGNVGAGTGATVGKVKGIKFAMTGGLGIAFQTIGTNVHLAAIAVVNAWGDVFDWQEGKIVAGAIDPETGNWLDAESLLLKGEIGYGFSPMLVGENTTLVCVITDAGLTKLQATKVAQWAQNGLALVIRPSHTMYDGDFSVVASVGNKRCDFHALCVATQKAVAKAILNAVKDSKPVIEFVQI